MGTVPSFRTWVAGEIVTAAEMNANIRDAGNFMIGQPFAYIWQSVAQSLANSTYAALTFDSTVVDSDGGHSNVTNNSRYTAKTPGWFQFTGGASFAVNATGSRGTQWSKTGVLTGLGAQALSFSGTAAVTTSVPAKMIFLPMNGTTDYVELLAFQSSGGALNTSVAAPDGGNMLVRWIHS